MIIISYSHKSVLMLRSGKFMTGPHTYNFMRVMLHSALNPFFVCMWLACHFSFQLKKKCGRSSVCKACNLYLGNQQLANNFPTVRVTPITVKPVLNSHTREAQSGCLRQVAA